jgi:hypothetical protein
LASEHGRLQIRLCIRQVVRRSALPIWAGFTIWRIHQLSRFSLGIASARPHDDAKCRKNYAGTSPITEASGKHKVVLARHARNRHLADACYLGAFASLTPSAGARAFYHQRRAGGDTHHRALRALANRLVGICRGYLRHQALYDEETAWAHRAIAEAA